MNDSLTNAEAAAREAVNARLGAVWQHLPAGPAADSFRQATTELAMAEARVADRLKTARDALANNDLYPDGRRERHRAEMEAAHVELGEARQRAEVNLMVAVAQATTAALPAPKGEAASTARLDAQMIVAAASDPSAALRAMATSTDPGVRHLAVSSYGESLLHAKGMSPDAAAELLREVRQTAINTTAADPDAGGVARAVAALDDAAAAIGGSLGMLASALDSETRAIHGAPMDYLPPTDGMALPTE